MPVEDKDPPVPFTNDTWGFIGSALPVYLVVAAFTPQLPNGLHQEEAAVHAGVGIRQAASVGVQREVAPGRRALVGHEVCGLSPAAKAHTFQGQHNRVGERIINHGQINVVVTDAGPSSALGPVSREIDDVSDGIMLIMLWSCPSAAPNTQTGSLAQLRARSAVVTIMAAPESVTKQQSNK